MKSFKKLCIAAILASLSMAVSAEPVAQTAVNHAISKQKQSEITPERAVELLKEGNQRFTSGKMKKRNLRAQVKEAGVNGQFPFAAVVSCMDSRAAPSLVFDQGIGDIFSARIAGNIVNEDILGSLEYAAKVAGSKAILVLGHTHCGAVKGACDNAQLGNLTQLVAKIIPAVKATPDVHGDDRSSKNHHFVDAVAETNVKMTVNAILEKSQVLKEMVDAGQIKIIGAMLDVETGKVKFY